MIATGTWPEERHSLRTFAESGGCPYCCTLHAGIIEDARVHRDNACRTRHAGFYAAVRGIAVYTREMNPWNSSMKLRRNFSVESTVTAPSSVTSPGVNSM